MIAIYVPSEKKKEGARVLDPEWESAGLKALEVQGCSEGMMGNAMKNRAGQMAFQTMRPILMAKRRTINK
jgi:hypothetical protein